MHLFDSLNSSQIVGLVYRFCCFSPLSAILMPMKLKNKTVGIWGYGRVGQSAAHFCVQLGANPIVYDSDINSLKNCSYSMVLSIDALLEKSDFIIPSPGIDITPYKERYAQKWLSELDLFQSLFQKKIIAITGSIGKTSITHMLTQTLQAAGWHVKCAGNIGIPMLSMIENQSELDAIVLEVSSFQLEHTRSFAPDLAIWTNFYPNHLDRHNTLEKYFQAKYQIIAHQIASQKALVPIQLKAKIEAQKPQSVVAYFDSTHTPKHHLSGFASNWLIIEKTLKTLQVPFPKKIIPTPLEHRLETVCKINDALVINDSKSTTPASTLAAIENQNAPRIVLFLGGLSKGIDRSKLIKALKNNVEVICFGAESQQLFHLCKKYSIAATQCTTMKDAIAYCMKIIRPKDVILFSPSGSSFDEFDNFEHRGNQFKRIVLSYKNQFDC